MTDAEWENTREKRVSNWRNFSKKRSKKVGSKGYNKSIRKPLHFQQKRPPSAPKRIEEVDSSKLWKDKEQYKKEWR